MNIPQFILTESQICRIINILHNGVFPFLEKAQPTSGVSHSQCVVSRGVHGRTLMRGQHSSFLILYFIFTEPDHM